MRKSLTLAASLLAGAFVGALVVALLGVMLSGCASAAPTAAEGRELLDHGSALSKCQDRGREAGALSAYYACKAEAGLR